MTSGQKEKVVKEIGELLAKKGWIEKHPGHMWERKDGAARIYFSSSVIQLYDFKRNKNGVKAATLMIKDVVLMEDGFRTEFVQIMV